MKTFFPNQRPGNQSIFAHTSDNNPDAEQIYTNAGCLYDKWLQVSVRLWYTPWSVSLQVPTHPAFCVLYGSRKRHSFRHDNISYSLGSEVFLSLRKNPLYLVTQVLHRIDLCYSFSGVMSIHFHLQYWVMVYSKRCFKSDFFFRSSYKCSCSSIWYR